MSTLPKTPFTLTGGCFCHSIRYTLSIPELSLRPKIPSIPTREIGPRNEINERLPLVSVDHCDSCRAVAGNVVMCWFIFPQAWAEFELAVRGQAGEEKRDGKLKEGGEKIKVSAAEYLSPSAELESKTHVRGFKSSEESERTFCGRCGTPISFLYLGAPGEVSKSNNWGPYCDITLGSIDKEGLEMDGMKLGFQTWMDDGIGWVKEMVNEGMGKVYERGGEKKKVNE